MVDTVSAIKRAVIGRPRATRELSHQLLPKWMALPVFSSDPMSSVAYATQEMMLVLALAGTAAYAAVMPLSIAVAVLLAIVVTSYRQTVRAYPHGGGAYAVAKENLGEAPGLVAAGALLIDYVLTVAVSIAAGVAAIASAVPVVADHRVLAGLVLVGLVTTANLRGAREAGTLFAIPTYAFVATILTMVAVGLVRCVGGCPQAPSAGEQVAVEQGLTLFLLLRAFASGATALTGVEAISNGVGAFRYPQSRNAATTLAVMGALAVTMFLGISFLAQGTGVVAHEGMTRTVTAEIALAVFGGGPAFYLVQVVTAAILVLAANTAYADFPRLASVLAADRYLPRQLLSRGDRLVFSNGVLVLAAAASLLLVAFGAQVTGLVQLYVVGVFTAFTLSQAGMVRHHLALKEPGWQRGTAINATGAVATGVVLVVVAATKLAGGAWIVLITIPAAALVMRGVNRHYRGVSLALRAGLAEPEPPRPNHVVVLIDRVDESAARAVSYARALTPASLRARAIPITGADVERRWADLAPDIPLEVGRAADDRRVVDELVRAVAEDRARHPEGFTTAVVAETRSSSWREVITRHRLALRVKARLVGAGGLAVANVTSPEGGPGPYTVVEPAEHHVVVLVSAVHRATTRALAYAEGLHATSVRALSVSLEAGHSRQMIAAWEDWGIGVPLELVDAPYRSLAGAVRDYVREFAADGRTTVVTCVLPEFVLDRWWQRPLHNQTALLIKAALLFERGVVTVSVPYPLAGALPDAQRAARSRG